MKELWEYYRKHMNSKELALLDCAAIVVLGIVTVLLWNS